jgi:hypothetical protein
MPATVKKSKSKDNVVSIANRAPASTVESNMGNNLDQDTRRQGSESSSKLLDSLEAMSVEKTVDPDSVVID